MGIAKVGLGRAVRMRLFVDEENSTNLIGDLTEKVLDTATFTLIAKFADPFVIKNFFFHKSSSSANLHFWILDDVSYEKLINLVILKKNNRIRGLTSRAGDP